MELTPKDVEKLSALARSSAGQALLALLRNQDASALNEAAAKASAGDYDAAQRTLSGLLTSPEARALLRQLEEKL